MPTVDDYARFFSGQISRQQIDALRERDGVANPSQKRTAPSKRTPGHPGTAAAAPVPPVARSDVDAFQRDLVERDTLRQRQVALQIADQHAAELRLEADRQRQELDRASYASAAHDSAAHDSAAHDSAAHDSAAHDSAASTPAPVDPTYDAYSVRTFDDF